MDQRVMGIETEYGLSHRPQAGAAVPVDELARALFAPVVSWGRSSNVFLPNGGRIYLDVGSHPEYATAECTQIGDLIAQDQAGDALVDDLRAQLEARYAQEGHPGAVHLFKNNVDSAQNSFGSHENYLIARTTRYARLVSALVPFLVTRQLIAGTGRVHPSGPPQFGPSAAQPRDDAPSFSFSQRADFMWEGSSSSTTRTRPLINTRDEPHADSSQYRRLHVIVGDSTLSPSTTALRMLSTDAMLRIIESGAVTEDLTLADPARALRQVSHDLTGTAALELADGRRMSALQLQETYRQKVERFIQRHGSHRDELPWALDLWGRTLAAVESQRWQEVAGEIDWAAKRLLLEQWCRSQGAQLSHPRAQQMDFAFHDIAPHRGLQALLRRRGMIVDPPWYDPEASQRARTTPPATRAALRGELVGLAKVAGIRPTVDWVHFKAPGVNPGAVALKDPFSTDPAQTAAVARALRGAASRQEAAPPPVI